LEKNWWQDAAKIVCKPLAIPACGFQFSLKWSILDGLPINLGVDPMRFSWRLVLCIVFICPSVGCQTTEKRKGIADSCYQPLYWPSEACPPGKK
jgi:hypothetical protein